MFRTRQAPSPTGYLHIGTARTVLFTKLFAMINEGKWYLRLEDTDRNRLQSEAVKTLLGALGQIGLRADEGISIESNDQNQPDDFYGIYQQGEFGPYIQSQRLVIYLEHAQNLIDQNLAYWSYLTPEDKQELQEIKQVTKRPINYYRVCSEKFSQDDLVQKVVDSLKDERKPVLMYRLQRNEKIICNDELLGKSEFDLSLEEDFGILKNDGYPTYHLAHLVDDHLMKTTMVIRSQEWFPSFPKHQTMFLDYWKTMPQYCHVPFILGENGNKKMSKRDGNVNMQNYLDKGYLPEALINYIAFLGWNPGTEKELYTDNIYFK
jgi:nondiscriminating glutamyl-tRNA synthetase